MGLFQKVMNRLGYVPKRRGYNAAKVNRLNEDWLTATKSIDSELRGSSQNLRQRSRDLYMNNDYAKKFIKLVSRNVVGPSGVSFQSKAKDLVLDKKAGMFIEKLDSRANKLIEREFKKWGKLGSCDITGKLNWVDSQRLTLDTVVRDGEIFIFKARDVNRNPYNYTLQLLEADYVDDTYSRTFNGESEIRMGVELDQYKKPIAYWVKTQNPGDYNFSTSNNRIRVSADNIIHVFFQERPEQTRGVPWMASPMIRMNIIGAYEEAEVTAARTGACTMATIESEAGDQLIGDDEDKDGNTIIDMEPGLIQKLAAGEKLNAFTPQHPSGNYEPFIKQSLKGVASGLDVSYGALSSDLSGTSFSSMRVGTIDERDMWRALQTWFISHFHIPVYESWLDMALLTKELNLPVSKYDKFNSPAWQPRGWAWVDPLKDQQANLLALSSGQKSLTEIVAERGKDLEEVLQQMQKDKEMAAKYGLTLNFDSKKTGGQEDVGEKKEPATS